MRLRIRKAPAKLFLLLIFSLTTIAAQAQNPLIVIRNVTLIDMKCPQPKPNITVLIAGNRIFKIGKNIKIPKDANIIDGNGKFLMPGLWE